jgi:2-amino-4-hydroxy-6-hydroxymethyldihydropteridine diphosphokinase
MPNMTVDGYVSLGSNMGDPAANLQRALEALDRTPGLALGGVSPVFRTEPQGLRDQEWFANCVARLLVDAALSPEDLLAATAAVEEGMGRERTTRWGPRVIDIDILLLGDAQWRSDRLQIPHPRMHERAFVLVPLMHLAPEVRIRGLCPSQWLSRLRYSVEGDRILQPEPISRGE